MVIGSYPCCGEPLAISLPDARLPVFMREHCPHCGAGVWHRLSRLDPESWTETEFLAEFVVDDEKKTIEPRSPQPR